MINREEIDELYKLYGFEIGESRTDTSVYLNSDGYFHNAEIIQFKKNEQELESLKEEYSQMGYSVHITHFSSIEETRNRLFSGFFNIKQSRKKLLQEYDSFCEHQSKKMLGNRYNYIEGRYFINGQLYTENLIDFICNILSSEGAQLIILEAAAGFGKTCTSYEVLKRLATDHKNKIPLLAELSKNRKASVFRYVLLSEIDRKFSALSSVLVTSEIRNGRVPLIIDGFDELLSKSTSLIELDSKEAEEAQTMLDTIAELLINGSNAKILLTSRKSSIFTGDIFDQWAETKLKNCSITRIQLAEPTPQDWLGHAKYQVIREIGISLDNILNPVLLSILRNDTLENIRTNYRNSDDILKKYFDLLLTREKDRQHLLLENNEQYEIMLHLASFMVQYDISSEETQFIKVLLFEIVDEKLEKLGTYLERYLDPFTQNPEERPTDEEFILKLVHHALLDRISTSSNRIGFVNEFIFGLLIGDAIINNILPITELSEKYISLATTSYAVKNDDSREELFHKLKPVISKLSVDQQILLDIFLVKRLTKNYSDQYFDSLIFKSTFNFNGDFKFIDCIFSSCTFDNCILRTSVFQSCHFYNCLFYNVKVINDTNNDRELIFSGCAGHENLQRESSTTVQIKPENEYNFEKFVLEQYWKVGYEIAEPRRTYRTLFRGTSSGDRAYISDAIESLIAKGILIKHSTYIELNFTKMNEIRRILGR